MTFVQLLNSTHTTSYFFGCFDECSAASIKPAAAAGRTLQLYMLSLSSAAAAAPCRQLTGTPCYLCSKHQSGISHCQAHACMHKLPVLWLAVANIEIKRQQLHAPAVHMRTPGHTQVMPHACTPASSRRPQQPAARAAHRSHIVTDTLTPSTGKHGAAPRTWQPALCRAPASVQQPAAALRPAAAGATPCALRPARRKRRALLQLARNRRMLGPVHGDLRAAALQLAVEVVLHELEELHDA